MKTKYSNIIDKSRKLSGRLFYMTEWREGKVGQLKKQ